jgi:endonuclease YncB( thermonuclease family)
MTRWAALCLVLLPMAAHCQTARIVDGDSLQIGPTRVRLAGIDAPELHQDCPDGWKAGQEAKLYMGWLIGGNPVRCEYSGTDKYGRLLGTCYAPPLPPASVVTPIELNRQMVRAGLAWAYREYSRAYVPEEDAARLAKRGLWAHNCVPAWQWRREHR